MQTEKCIESRTKEHRQKDCPVIVCTIIACMFIAGFLFSSFGEMFIRDYMGISPYGYMTYFFNRENDVKKESPEKVSDKQQYKPEPNSQIILFDPDDDGELSSSRLAGVIETLSSFRPRVLAFDLLYPDSSHQNNPLHKERIQLAIANSSCPVLFPSVVSVEDAGAISYTKSFFIDSTSCSASIPDFFHFTRYDSVDPSIELFSFAVARQSGYLREELMVASKDKDFIPDYRWKDISIISSLSGCVEENIKDKIVIIGNRKDFKDLKLLPFKIQGTNIITGVELNTYLINSLITPSEPDNRPFQKSWVADFLICLVLLAIYSMVTHRLNCFMYERKNIHVIFLLLVFKFLLIVGWEYIVYRICDLITTHFHIVFNLIALFISCLFVDTMDTLFYNVFKKPTS